MIKKLVTIGIAAAHLTASVPPVFVTKPVIQAYNGHDIAGFAQNGQPDTGAILYMRQVQAGADLFQEPRVVPELMATDVLKDPDDYL